MNLLVLMAGNSTNFEGMGYPYPKYLMEIDGLPLIQHVVRRLTEIDNVKPIFCIRHEHDRRFHLGDVLRLLVPDSEVIAIEGETKGAACTALLAVEHINNDEPLIITNGDQIVDVNHQRFIDEFEKKNMDGGIVVFESVHPRWSFVRLDESDHVIETAEKRPLSKNATAGMYYFKKGSDFVSSAMSMIEVGNDLNGLYYVCPVYNEMVLNHAQIGVFRIDKKDYHSLATPQDVERYGHIYEQKESII
ncbi:MAG: glycosyltransferase family 2 protein [Deltaproteobacteria bacterium]|nr:glycosyltransferase family 2 protein [Deltaproteobacteria bacterium]